MLGVETETVLGGDQRGFAAERVKVVNGAARVLQVRLVHDDQCRLAEAPQFGGDLLVGGHQTRSTIDNEQQHVEKYAEKFEINMLRCIYCGLCEEVCPEEAIFMSKTYVVTGLSRELMIFDKHKLFEIGGTRHDAIQKWSAESKGIFHRFYGRIVRPF